MSSSRIPWLTVAIGGVGAVVLVVGGTLAGAAAPGSMAVWWSVPAIPVEPRADLAVALGLFYGGLILLVRAWLRLRRIVLERGLTLAAVVVVAVVWAIPFVLGPPLGSRDVYAYGAQGRLAAEGIDVFSEGPAALGEDPVLAPVDPLYLEAPVVYGPTFVALAAEVAERSGDALVWSVLAWRAIAVASLAIAGAAVVDITRRRGRDPADALVLTVANPLVLLHLVSGAHNEAPMLALLMSGVAVGSRPRWRHLGLMLCAMAATIKLPAILGVVFLAWPWAMAAPSVGRRIGRLVAASGETLAVVTLATRSTPWGWGWIDALVEATPVDAYLSVTRLAGGAVHLLFGLEPAPVLAVARALGVALAAVSILALLFHRRRDWALTLAWALMVSAVLHPTTQPWYLTWGLLLLAATTAGERNRGLVGVCVAAVFVVLPVGPHLGSVFLEDYGPMTIVAGLLVLSLLTLSPRPHRSAVRRTDVDPDVVTVVVPTRDERANVGPLVAAVEEATVGLDRRVEVLFVDDSADDTAHEVRRVAASSSLQVDVRHRLPDERWGGLGGAVVDGLTRSTGAVVAVVDGDLQHPPTVVPDLVHAIDRGATVAVASRRIPGGSDGDGLSPTRLLASRAMGALVRALFPNRIGPVADPLSGCFAVRVDRLDLDRLQPDGFKILCEILATQGPVPVTEVPYRFRSRAEGVSKASVGQAVRFVSHVLDLRVRTIPIWAGASRPPVERAVLERV